VYGREGGKEGAGIMDEGVVRNDWSIGPHGLCGSIVKGMRMVLASASSWIMVFPLDSERKRNIGDTLHSMPFPPPMSHTSRMSSLAAEMFQSLPSKS
jgi:hypothetical protein